jgi:hypothetical protein
MTHGKCTFQSALLILIGLAATPAAAQISIGYPGPYGRGAYDLTSSVRLQVTPTTADVFVDGYYAGKVDEFDGTFQRLRVEPGEHEIQLFLPGHRLHSQKVYLQPGNTFKVRHTMERLAPGEAEPLRPESLAAPRPGAAPPAPHDRRASGSDAGSVTLRVQPGDATILIDGQRWNAASDEPLTVQLDAGPHTVEVRKAGFRGYITEVNVEPGRSLPLNISLSPE